MVASQAPPTEDLACNPGMCPDGELNWRPFDSQARTQSTEPHQPGQNNDLFLVSVYYFFLTENRKHILLIKIFSVVKSICYNFSKCPFIWLSYLCD